MILTYTLAIVLLFYILGYSAEVVVDKAKSFAENYGFGLASLGMLLGMLTTIPEFFLGINASINDMPEIYFGNLMGGIIVMFCLILGLSAILNRKIVTDGKYSNIVPIAVYISLPAFIGLKGYLDQSDGLLLIFIYILFLYKNLRNGYAPSKTASEKTTDNKDGFIMIIVGLTLVMVTSSGIIKLSSEIFSFYDISPFITGLLLFSIGTNLPEIVVAFKSWAKKSPDLSLGHITGSALANIFVVGIFTTIKPIELRVDTSYKFFLLSLIASLFILARYYHSDRSLTKEEGKNLLILYLFFIIGQFLFSF